MVREHLQQPLIVDPHVQNTLNGVDVQSSVTENKSHFNPSDPTINNEDRARLSLQRGHHL
jgi:hypothetical protein